MLTMLRERPASAKLSKRLSLPVSLAAVNPRDYAGASSWFDFGNANTMFKDTARTQSVTTAADAILGVTDQGAAAAHLSEATNGPAYQPATINSRAVGRFDGTNDQLTATVAADTSATYFVVTQKRSAPTASSRTVMALGSQLHTNSGPSATAWLWFSNQAAGTVVVGGTAANLSAIVLRVNSASSLDYWVGGGASANMDPADDVTTATSLRVGSAGGSNFGDYDVCEIIRYDSALSLAAINQLGRYLSGKWGAAWATAS